MSVIIAQNETEHGVTETRLHQGPYKVNPRRTTAAILAPADELLMYYCSSPKFTAECIKSHINIQNCSRIMNADPFTWRRTIMYKGWILCDFLDPEGVPNRHYGCSCFSSSSSAPRCYRFRKMPKALQSRLNPLGGPGPARLTGPPSRLPFQNCSVISYINAVSYTHLTLPTNREV